MILILIQLIFITKGLYLKNQYRTRGLNTLNISLDDYDGLIQGSTTINIVLENNSQTTYSFLAYCYSTSFQTVKTILSTINTVKSHIESNKKQCVFDNNALLYFQKAQQLVLTDILTEKEQQIYNKFSIYPYENRELQIYIYSNEETSYSVTIQGSQKGSCLNNCNQQGQCVSSTVSFCLCQDGFLDSTCQLKTTVVSSPSFVQFDIQQQSLNLLTIPIINKGNNVKIEFSANSQIQLYVGCLYDKEYVPFYKSVSFKETTQTVGSLTLTNDDLEMNNEVVDEMEQVLQSKIDKFIILLIVNDQFYKISIYLKIFNDSSNDDSNGLEIYYILAGALGALIVALLIIICIIYYQRKTRRIENQNNSINARSFSKSPNQQTFLKKDSIPVELYEQILQEYPGLSEITECQICLVEFQKQDLVKLTYCLHLFHSICLDQWRRRNQTCPFCRDDFRKHNQNFMKQDQQIYKLGVIQGDAIQMDEQKLEEMKKLEVREQRLRQLQQTSSPGSGNDKFGKENTPSPFLGVVEPLNQQLFRLQEK